MQETSALYRRVMATEDHWFETSVVVGEVGDLITTNGDRILFGPYYIRVADAGADSGYGEDVIKSLETNVEMFPNEPIVGKAVSGEFNLVMNKPYGDIPRMGLVIPYVRVLGHGTGGTGAVVLYGILNIQENASVVNNILTLADDSGAFISDSILTFIEASHGLLVSEWLQQGKFYIDTREYTNDDDGLPIITLHGYDAMMLAEQDYGESALDYGDPDDPDAGALDIDMLEEIASKMKPIGSEFAVGVDPRCYEIMTEGYKFPYPVGYSLREMLQMIAAAYAGCFVISDKGELLLVTLYGLPENTGYLVTGYGFAITFGGDRIVVDK